jgi:hypothetical protein
MAPGPGNPLGARAFCPFQDGRDTRYRIHGACEPQYLGKAVSSDCIRLLDQDIIDLHDRLRDGATVVVLASVKPEGLDSLPCAGRARLCRGPRRLAGPAAPRRRRSPRDTAGGIR